MSVGRTNPTYRDTLTALQQRWGAYRRGLRVDDQPHFDRLFAHARAHADAGGLLNHPRPLVPALMSIALEQEWQIAALEARIAALEGG